MAKYLNISYGDEVITRERYVKIKYYNIADDCNECLEASTLTVRNIPFRTHNGQLIAGSPLDPAFASAVHEWYKALDVDTLDQAAVDALKVAWSSPFGILIDYVQVFGDDPIYAS